MSYKNSYTDIHEWLGKTYGKANHCEFCETKTAKRYEYALKKERQHKDEQLTKRKNLFTTNNRKVSTSTKKKMG